jgi:hypothetical protein
MESDHFDPKLRGAQRHKYGNLFPAVHHCNNRKRDYWPTVGDVKKGIRYLNCCDEQDYGEQIFENPDTHELVGVTSAGRFHIDQCDLNAPHFVRERRERSALRAFLQELPVLVSTDFVTAKTSIQQLREDVELMIPPIQPPPVSG